MNPEYYAPRTHEKMKDVLMNPKAKGPEIHYYMIRGGREKKNITIWQTGTVGGEYIKTYGHYHVGGLDEVYLIAFGEGIALLQRRATDTKGHPIADKIVDFKVIKVRPGDEVYMPADYAHLLVNTGDSYLVTVDDSPVEFLDSKSQAKNEASMPGHADYEPIKKMHGFAYYVVEKEGKPVLVKNPKYKKVPEVKLDF